MSLPSEAGHRKTPPASVGFGEPTLNQFGIKQETDMLRDHRLIIPWIFTAIEDVAWRHGFHID